MVVLILRSRQHSTARTSAEIEAVKGRSQIDKERIRTVLAKNADVSAVSQPRV